MDQMDAALLEEAKEQLAESSSSLEEAAEAMDMSADQARAAARIGALVTFSYRDLTLVPNWQLPTGESGRPLAGVRELNRAFGGDVLGLSAWAVTPNPHLHGDPPQKRLAKGDLDSVLAAVGAIGAAAF
jgi:hypothetical protein